MKMKKRFLSILLSLVMVLGLMPGMSLTAYADNQKAYAAYDVTTNDNKTKSVDALTALQVKFNGKSWYIIADDSTAVNAGTVTLLAAESFGNSKFDDSSNKYSTSTIKATLYNMTASGGDFADVASAINTVKVKGSESDGEVDAKLYLLNKTEASNVPENVRKFSTDWWLRSPGSNGPKAAFVNGSYGGVNDYGNDFIFELGVRPALKLDLSKVTFDSTSKTFSVPTTPYPLWVGGTQVTSANATNITGEETVTASYDADNHTLTLNGATISGGSYKNAAIYAEGMNLTIDVKGDSTVTGPANSTSYGIYLHPGSLTITGVGTLTAAGGTGSDSTGIRTHKYNPSDTCNVTIAADTSLTAIGNGTSYSDGVNAEGVVTVNGTLTAISGTCSNSRGINVNAMSGNYTVIINENGKLTASGNKAIVGTVKNAIAGTAWTNVDGTEGQAVIAESTTGQSLSSYKKVQFPAAAHTHDFTYIVNYDTVTAECTAGCPDGYDADNAPTLTIVAPTLTTYGQTGEGISAAATLTGLKDFNTATGLSVSADSIQYFKAKHEGMAVTKDGDALSDAPTDAGDYLAEITLSGVKTTDVNLTTVTAYVTYTIAKANPAADDFTFTAPTDLIYSDAAKSATVTAKTDVTGMGDVTVKYYSDAACATEAEPKNVGAYYTGITVAEGDNYNATESGSVLSDTSWTFEITEAASAAATVTANNRTYDGTEQPLVTVDDSTLVGGEMQYALGTATEATEQYTTSIPTATDAGSYYVWYKVVGDENHTDSVPACVRVSIQEVKLTLNLSEKKILVGQSFTLTAKVTASGTVDQTVTWSSSKPKVATVSKKGVVKAVRAGSTVITATLANGVKAKCRVSVKYRYVYRCVKNGVYRITTNAKLVRQLKKEGWKYGKVFRVAGVSGTKVYWVYNKTTKRFRWTTNRAYAVRQKKAGNKAGLAFYASDSKSLPVYELCKEGKRPTYFYTMKASEVASMQKAGWKSKGIVFYSEPKALK